MISVFLDLQGRAEALIRWGGKIYHPPIARFQQNISAKIIKIQQRLLELQRKMSGGLLLRHSVYTPFLQNTSTGQTHWPILMLYGSNDVASPKDVPFWGFVDMAPDLGDQISPKTPFWGRE